MEEENKRDQMNEDQETAENFDTLNVAETAEPTDTPETPEEDTAIETFDEEKEEPTEETADEQVEETEETDEWKEPADDIEVEESADDNADETAEDAVEEDTSEDKTSDEETAESEDTTGEDDLFGDEETEDGTEEPAEDETTEETTDGDTTEDTTGEEQTDDTAEGGETDDEDDDLDVIDADEEDDSLIEDTDDTDDDEDDESAGGRSKKNIADRIAERQRKKKEKQLLKDKKKRKGLKIIPYENAEDENPDLKLYNEIARHAYNYDNGAIPRNGMSDKKVAEIFGCVMGDFPEIFWVKSYSYTPDEMFLNFRCTKANGELDVKQIEKKLAELKSGARYFTRGIGRRTDPYKALITIYKRLILTLDYDSKGLDARIDLDMSKDDRLRSLHSALVRHKTVCAGYAAAMQYLLQSVGITCAYVRSEIRNGSCHAFNIVKIGKYCYYLDATWGDISNTKNGGAYSDFITYDYCCVPYDEFIKTDKSELHNHIPAHEIYPWFKKELKANRHEYFRYRKCFISRYNEDDLVRVFVNNALNYDPVEDGRFSVSFRCTSKELATQIVGMIRTPANYVRIINKAKAVLEKNKRASRLLDRKIERFIYGTNPVVSIFYVKDEQKKKK